MSAPEVQRDLVELMRLLGRNRFLKPRDIPQGEQEATQILITLVRSCPSQLVPKCEEV